MRDYWTDFRGRKWPIVKSRRRLKFKYASHAALRAHVFHRDRFCCVRCGVAAINVPDEYDGSKTLSTSAMGRGGFPVDLALDHLKTLKAGGRNTVENLQALCETCNRKKQPEDRAAVDSRRDVAVTSA